MSNRGLLFSVYISDYFILDTVFIEYTAEDTQTIIEHARFVGGRYWDMAGRGQIRFLFPTYPSLKRFGDWVQEFYRQKLDHELPGALYGAIV